MEGSSRGGVEQSPQGCYDEWMSLAARRMVELQEALAGRSGDDGLGEIARKVVGDFQDYMEKRSELSRRHSSMYFAPSWNTYLENALLWMAGCRPSSFIRLIHALCGSQTESKLSQFLHNEDGDNSGNSNRNDDDRSSSSSSSSSRNSGNYKSGGAISDLSAEQLAKINDLHMITVQEEDKLTKRLASLQEDTADLPITVVACGFDRVGKASEAVESALDRHEAGMGGVMEEADSLRLRTLKKILEILTPVQAAELLLAGKKLHLSIHEWGRTRDRLHGYTEGVDGGDSSGPAN